MNPYRREKLASNIRVILSEAITQELNDPRIAPVTTITRVELSRDFVNAKVFFTVVGGEADERRTLAGLQHARGRLQRFLGSELSIRQCPRVQFEIDYSVRIARETLRMIDENRREGASSDPGEPETDENPGSVEPPDPDPDNNE